MYDNLWFGEEVVWDIEFLVESVHKKAIPLFGEWLFYVLL